MNQDRHHTEVDDVLPQVEARSEFDERSNRAVAQAQASAMRISEEAFEFGHGHTGTETADARGDSGRSGSLGDVRKPGEKDDPARKPGDTLTT